LHSTNSLHEMHSTNCIPYIPPIAFHPLHSTNSLHKIRGVLWSSLTCILNSFSPGNYVEYQRGLSEAHNGYTFCMLLGYGPTNLQVLSSALICRADFKAVKFETCKLGGPYLISRGVNPTFWAAICCIWPARTLNWVIFYVLESLQ
jgi:hypothetical protein